MHSNDPPPGADDTTPCFFCGVPVPVPPPGSTEPCCDGCAAEIAASNARCGGAIHPAAVADFTVRLVEPAPGPRAAAVCSVCGQAFVQCWQCGALFNHDRPVCRPCGAVVMPDMMFADEDGTGAPGSPCPHGTTLPPAGSG